MTYYDNRKRTWWHALDGSRVAETPADLMAAHGNVRQALQIVRAASGGHALAFGGEYYTAPAPRAANDLAWLGELPPIYPEWLGDRAFTETHGCRFPYVVGEMAQGIATARMVTAASRAGLMAFFGSAGLAHDHIRTALTEIRTALGPGAANWGANLIHTPQAPADELATAELLIQEGARRVSASAFMKLSPAVVWLAARGLVRDERSGRIVRAHHLFAKVSRPEVARAFMMPPPEAMLRELVSGGRLTAAEAELASRIPIALDITAEADSGGHTDNRPLGALLPALLHTRAECRARREVGGMVEPGEDDIRIGAAGGIGTPGAAAAAFQLGAAYVLTGSINQCAVESGLAEPGRAMLAEAGLADVCMAPAADMFELGVKVQVLRRGTLFGARADKLYRLYRSYPSLDVLPEPLREELERDLFLAPLATIWDETRRYFSRANPAEVARAEADPHHRMALVFRWYLFNAARWAREGVVGRRADYQIWCGPAMGAFNAWTAGTFLARPEQRSVVQIALNLMEGAAAITRLHQLRSMGFAIANAGFDFRPRPLCAASETQAATPPAVVMA